MTEDERSKFAEKLLLEAYDKLAAENRELLKSKVHDQISVSDILVDNDQPRDLEYLIVRYLIRWCMEAIGDRAGAGAVDSAFSSVYFQICAQHIASDAVRENKDLYSIMLRI